MFAFSVRTLLVAVAVAALGVSALLQRTPIWTSAIVSLAMVLFMTAAILAMIRPATRTFWIPVALIGWTYLAVIFVQPLAGLHRSLITTPLIAKVGQWVLPAEVVPHVVVGGPGGFGGGYGQQGYPGGFNPNQTLPAAPKPPAVQSLDYSVDQLVSHIFNMAETEPFSNFYFTSQALLSLVIAFAGGMTFSFFLRGDGKTLSPEVSRR